MWRATGASLKELLLIKETVCLQRLFSGTGSEIQPNIRSTSSSGRPPIVLCKITEDMGHNDEYLQEL